jgi:hypothetical protein
MIPGKMTAKMRATSPGRMIILFMDTAYCPISLSATLIYFVN